MQRGGIGSGNDEDRNSGIPRRVAPGFESGADAAGREGGGVRLAADKRLARELADGLTGAGGRDESIMLFSGEAGHGLEPVGVMGGTHFDGPVLHGAGDDIGDFGIEPAAFVNNALKFLVHFLGQALAHHVQREDILSVDVISGLPRFAGLAHRGSIRGLKKSFVSS